LENKFTGMTDHVFTYNDFEETREKLIHHLYLKIRDIHKQFLLDFEAGHPDWKLYNFSKFPGIQWKQLNIQKLKNNNPDKHNKLLTAFSEKLNSEEK
jgi:hypothetical protein